MTRVQIPAPALLFIRKICLASVRLLFVMDIVQIFCVISGLLIAILLRLLGQSGIIIAIGGVIMEVFGLIAVYFVFRKYIRSEEKSEITEVKKKISKK